MFTLVWMISVKSLCYYRMYREGYIFGIYCFMLIMLVIFDR